MQGTTVWMAGLAMGLMLGTGASAQTAAGATVLQAPGSHPAGSGAGVGVAQATTLPKTPAAVFPPVNPKNFTASSPSVETVNSFLHALWGFDENREWSVAAIEPTAAPGVVQVRVYVSEKTQPGRMAQSTLFITPDGKHAIAGEVVSFGAQPFTEARDLLRQEANGASRGAAGKELEIVEFADLQCATCKTEQSTVDTLLETFPQAHFVFEDMPITAVHPEAMHAAEVGYCVRQAKGDAAFFTFQRKVYDLLSDMTAAKQDATLRAAVTAAGADPAAVMSCAATPAAQDAVNATIKLGTSIGINNEPTLVINGRVVPMAQAPLDALQRVVVYQGKLDGIAVHEQPRLTSLQ